MNLCIERQLNFHRHRNCPNQWQHSYFDERGPMLVFVGTVPNIGYGSTRFNCSLHVSTDNRVGTDFGCPSRYDDHYGICPNKLFNLISITRRPVKKTDKQDKCHHRDFEWHSNH